MADGAAASEPRQPADGSRPGGIGTIVFRELFWPYGEYRRPRSRLQRALRWTKRVVLVLLVAYGVLFFYPQPLFPNSLRHENLVLHAQGDLGPDAAAVLTDAYSRVARSGLFRREKNHHVFLCDGWVPYRAFKWSGGRETFASANPLTRNIIVANPNVLARKAYRYRSRSPESRDLAAILAHEITHNMLRDEYGFFGSRHLPMWKKEGYCEYIAGDSAFDFERGVAMLKTGETEEKMPFRYFHWRLLATFALDAMRMDVTSFFKEEVTLGDLDQRMLAGLRDGSFQPKAR